MPQFLIFLKNNWFSMLLVFFGGIITFLFTYKPSSTDAKELKVVYKSCEEELSEAETNRYVSDVFKLMKALGTHPTKNWSNFIGFFWEDEATAYEILKQEYISRPLIFENLYNALSNRNLKADLKKYMDKKEYLDGLKQMQWI